MVQHSAIDHAGITGVGLDSGTSMPGGPSTNDLFYRTDLDLLFVYDGTRWVCTCLHTAPWVPDRVNNVSTIGTLYRAANPISHDIYLTTIDCVTVVDTTNDGSNFWTVTSNKIGTAGVTSLGNFTTAADTAGVYSNHQITVNAVVDVSDYATLQIGPSLKTSNPGTILLMPTVFYRLIGT